MQRNGKTLKTSLLVIAAVLFCGGIFFTYARSSYNRSLDEDFLTGTLGLRDLTSEDERWLDRMTFGIVSCFVLSGIAGVAGFSMGSGSNSSETSSTGSNSSDKTAE